MPNKPSPPSDPNAKSDPDLLKAKQLFREVTVAVAEGNNEVAEQKGRELETLVAKMEAENSPAPSVKD